MAGLDLLAFDLMDTVVVDPFMRSMAELGREAADELRQSLDPTAWIDFELGLIDEPRFLERIFVRPPPDAGLTAEKLRESILGGYAFVGGMEALLGELRASGRRLWVLSNYPPWAERIRAQLELDRFFEGYAISYRTGARKPDEAAYLCLCSLAAVEPGSCLLVDDRRVNLEGARRAGMSAVHFSDAEGLRGELRRLGLID